MSPPSPTLEPREITVRVVAEPIPCPVVLAQPTNGEPVLIFRVGLLPAGVLALLGKLLAHL